MSVADRATAFKNEITGAATNKIVCKASSHELAGPKKKHVDYLIQLTNNPNCSIPGLADLMSERLQKNSNWVVVFKTLVVAHNLMSLGNEKFLQCLATREKTFSVDLFNDRSNALGVEMSVYLRKYAKYLTYLCTSYRILAMDVARIPKGENSPFRRMDAVKLLKTAGIVQQQLDYLMEVDVSQGELTNGVINTAFLMLYKDLIKLYTVYNDALINLLEKFFEMKKPQCRETIEIYRKFLTRQEGVQSFLQLAEDVGVDKQTHLNLRQVPEDLLPALKGHLSEMDHIKKANSAEASPIIKAASEKLAALKDQTPPKENSQKKLTEARPIIPGMPSASDEILETQRKRFEELKKRASQTKLEVGESDSQKSSSSLSKTENGATSFDDILGLSLQPAPKDNPFQSSPWGNSTTAAPQPAAPYATTNSINPFQSEPSFENSLSDPWAQPAAGRTRSPEVDIFQEIRGQPNFDAVFGQNSNPPRVKPAAVAMGQYTMGDILVPQAVGPLSSSPAQLGLQPVGLTGDVDTSLVAAAQNLSVELSESRTGLSKKTEHQWSPQKETIKTGGPNYQWHQLQPQTLPPQAQSPNKGAPVDWNKGMYSGYFPVQQQQQQQHQQPQQPVFPLQTQQPVFPAQPQHMFPVQNQQPFMMQPQQQQMWGQQQQQPQANPFQPFGTQQQASLF